MSTLGMVVVVAGLAVSVGCASYEVAGTARAALPLPPDVQRYYQCPSTEVKVTVRTTETHPEYSVKEVTLFVGDSNEPIRVDWFARMCRNVAPDFCALPFGQRHHRGGRVRASLLPVAVIMRPSLNARVSTSNLTVHCHRWRMRFVMRSFATGRRWTGSWTTGCGWGSRGRIWSQLRRNYHVRHGGGGPA